MNTVVRKGKFDAGHRVMHERFKCFNLHGHEYRYELEFSYTSSLDIGYAIDFKEIKRIACQWIDEVFDHGFIANPCDTGVIQLCYNLGSKLYVMHLQDQKGFCNPTAENIAKELFYAVSRLVNTPHLTLKRLRLHETVNCFVDCMGLSTLESDTLAQSSLEQLVFKYRAEKGVVEYDDRNLP